MKRNRMLRMVLCLVLALGLATPAVAAQTVTVDPINVMVGGKDFLPTDVNGNDVPVFVYNGTTYAPLRALAEAYGLNVGYNAEKKLATVDGTPSADFVGSKGTAPAITKRTSLTVSPISIEVNGAVFQPKDVTGKSVPVFVYNGTTYAPLRALAEAYGLSVGYNSEKKLATVDFVSTAAIDFSELLEEINANRKAELEAPLAFDGFADYLVDDPTTKDLLSQEEVDALLNPEEKQVTTVTYPQAVNDVDLLFRALHVGYASYYYFGQEAFEEAEAEVMAWLEGQTDISVSKLTVVLRSSLSFMVDAHSYVGYKVDSLEGIRYEYHHCTSQQYGKDQKGFYKEVNGQRLDFVSFSDDRVTLEPTLLSTGKLVYSPVLFCPDAQVASVTVQLKTANGTLCTETVNWTRAEDVPMSDRSINYRFLKENGLAYINIDCFDYTRKDEYRDDFLASATQIKDCKAVIFDLRANGGGTGNPTDEWVRRFTGETPEVREARAERDSILKSGRAQSIYEYLELPKGKWLSNDIPVIVLVDDACGSSGEDSLKNLKTMENVLVVGTNSAGFNLGGNCIDITLPYTNIDASLGTFISFAYDITNTDCIGYKPDVWCESDAALEVSLALLADAGIVSEDVANDFVEAVIEILPQTSGDDSGQPEHENSALISLHLRDMVVKAGSGFGIGGGSHTAEVYLNDVPVTDFTVSVEDPTLCTVRKTGNGTFELTKVKSGQTTLTVQCGNIVQRFNLKVVGTDETQPEKTTEPEESAESSNAIVSEPGYENWPYFVIDGEKLIATFGYVTKPGTYTAKLFVDGIQVTSYTSFESENSAVCSASDNGDGTFTLHVKKAGEVSIQIHYNERGYFRTDLRVTGYTGKVTSQSGISLWWHNKTIKNGYGFGVGGQSVFVANVMLNGEKQTEYSAVSEDGSCVCTVQSDGSLLIQKPKSGKTWITVVCNGETARFSVNS